MKLLTRCAAAVAAIVAVLSAAAVPAHAGTISFVPANESSPYSMWRDIAGSLTAADVNRDGNTDLVAVGENGSDIYVWWGNGDGTFNRFPLAACPGTVDFQFGCIHAGRAVVADMNGDGYPDIVSTVDLATFSILYYDPGARKFDFTDINTGASEPAFVDANGANDPQAVAVGQVNGDACRDVVTGSYSKLDQFFNPPYGFECNGPPGEIIGYVPPVSAGEVTLADNNEPDLADAAIGDFVGAGLVQSEVALDVSNNALWINTPGFITPGTPWPLLERPAPPCSQSMISGDFNGDGLTDLAISHTCDANGATDNAVAILLGNGNGTFTQAADAQVPFRPNQIAVGDLDGNGKADLAVEQYGGTQAAVLLGNGDGTFQDAQVVDFGLSHALTGITIGDFNNDGRADLAGSTSNHCGCPETTPTVAVLLNQGSGVDEPPVLSLPTGPIVAEATGPNGATVTFDASATDKEDGTVPVTCKPASGSVFPLGTTEVDCSATDSGGNTVKGSFDVKVQDTTPPKLTVPGDFAVDATSPAGATVTFTTSAVDLVDGSVPVTCTPSSGSVFAIGDTTVGCTATDAHDNTANASFTVHVRGAGEQLQALATQVAGLGPGGSLVAKVAAVQLALAAGDKQDACDALAALANEARAQAGKTLSAADAAAIEAASERIAAVLGC